MKPFACALILSLALSNAQAACAQGADVGFASAWPELTPAERDHVMGFAEEFKEFMGKAKSEMLFVREGVKFAEARGFKRWQPNMKAADLKPGSRWFSVNRDRTLVLFIIGTEPIENGMRIVNTHI